MKANIRKIDQIPKLLIIISITIPDEIAFDNPSNWDSMGIFVEGVPSIKLLKRNGIAISNGERVNNVSFKFLRSKVFLSTAYINNIGKTIKINDCLMSKNIANNANHIKKLQSLESLRRRTNKNKHENKPAHIDGSTR